MKEIYAAVRRLETAADGATVKSETKRLTEILGFEFTRVQVLEREGHTPDVRDGLMLHTYGADLEKAYLEGGLHAVDPTLIATRRAARPYELSELGELLGVSMAHNQLLEKLHQRSIQYGLFTPAYGPNGLAVHVGLTSRRPVEISEDFRRIIQYTAQTAVVQAERLGLFARKIAKSTSRSNGTPSLSKREREVLLWIARGKSNAVIGDILGISEHTVGTLVKRVFAKLEVSNRVAAAVKGVALRLINIGKDDQPAASSN
ncbi:MAG: LuxR C-terminal-related transcriptional regulator [Pseudomonadota bacterium]